MKRLFPREKCERDPGLVAFLPAQAGPKSGVNNGFDCFCIGQRRQVLLAPADRVCTVPRKVRVQRWGDGSGSGVGLAFHCD